MSHHLPGEWRALATSLFHLRNLRHLRIELSFFGISPQALLPSMRTSRCGRGMTMFRARKVSRMVLLSSFTAAM